MIKEDSTADIVMENVNLKEIGDDQHTGWEITTKEAHIFKHQRTVNCKSLICSLLCASDTNITLHCGAATINQDTKNVSLYQGVEGRYGDITIKGDEFSYLFDDHKIYTNQSALLFVPEGTFRADALDIDLKESTIHLTGNVRCEFSAGSSTN